MTGLRVGSSTEPRTNSGDEMVFLGLQQSMALCMMEALGGYTIAEAKSSTL